MSSNLLRRIRSIPVMNQMEYRAIMREIYNQATNARLEPQREAARRLFAAVHMMATYGLRVGSLRTIEVYGDYFVCKIKSNKELTGEFAPIFRSFHFQNGRPFTQAVATIQKAFKRVTQKLSQAGIIRHPYSCHDLRHFCAVWLYTKTRDIAELQKLLGHSSLAVTDAYLQSLGINASDR